MLPTALHCTLYGVSPSPSAQKTSRSRSRSFLVLVLLALTLPSVWACSSNKKTDDETTTTLSAPANLTATAGVNKVTLDWDAVSGATSYTVYWKTSSGDLLSDSAITSVSDDNYTHSSLSNGTTYYHKVVAVNSAGTGTLSSETSVMPSATWSQQAYVKAVNRKLWISMT